MSLVIKEYTFNAVGKQITVTQAGYTDISPEEIQSIFNASTGTWIYNPGVLKYGTAPTSLAKFYPLTSVVNGVITYTAPNSDGTTNDDVLVISLSRTVINGGTP